MRGTGSAGLVIAEHGIRYAVDVVGGQKTGFYLDQRDNRRRIGELAGGRDVLDCFGYTGGFALNALRGGARSVLCVDSSGDAVAAAMRNAQSNGLDDGRGQWVEADVFKHLRLLRDQARQFDLIVLDPTGFAPPRTWNAPRARTRTSTCWDASCCGRADCWRRSRARRGRHRAVSKDRRGRGRRCADRRADHRPVRGHQQLVLLSFPEGDYLKGLLVRLANPTATGGASGP